MESPISLAVELANPYLVRKILEAFPDKVNTNIDVSLTNKKSLLHAAVELNVCASKIVKYVARIPDRLAGLIRTHIGFLLV